ncbi:MAG: AMP-binding protein [Dehalococcoidales bacterium]|nr:AMP-binding protein [Dehalococcoidales bacterium]
MMLTGFIGPRIEDEERYIANGWWLNITFGDVLDKAAENIPDKEALIENELRLTYGQLRDIVDRLAAGLSELGIGRGDCVLLQLPNWAEYLFSFYALQRIGAIAVLLLPRHSHREINHFSRLTQAKAWIVPEKYHNTDYLPVIEQALEANPSLRQVITVRGKENSPYLSFETLLSGSTSTFSGTGPEPSDVAFIMPTGGTTGLPKAVPRTHNSAICDARYRTEARAQGDCDTCLLSIPLEHNLGLAAMNGTVFTGGKLVFLDSTRPEDFYKTVQKEKITCAPLVPTLLSRLVRFTGYKDYNLVSLKALYVGGAKTPADVIQSLHRKLGNIYICAFGMSEGTGCTTRLDDTEDVIISSVGRPCCPHDDYRVLDEQGNELPVNTEGELVVKGPSIFFGYLDNPEENERAFTKDGYFITGDRAVIDDDGCFRITGRSKDLIIRGGENISPADIEAMVRTHPDVEDVAVIGVPDEEFGEKACAYLKTRGGLTPSLADITGFLKEQGASVLQLPEVIEFIDKIPLTNIGKPDKKALREDYAKRRKG